MGESVDVRESVGLLAVRLGRLGDENLGLLVEATGGQVGAGLGL